MAIKCHSKWSDSVCVYVCVCVCMCVCKSGMKCHSTELDKPDLLNSMCNIVIIVCSISIPYILALAHTHTHTHIQTHMHSLTCSRVHTERRSVLISTFSSYKVSEEQNPLGLDFFQFSPVPWPLLSASFSQISYWQRESGGGGVGSHTYLRPPFQTRTDIG